MGSLDLSNAYHSISTSLESQKYLKFSIGHYNYANLLHCEMV